MPLPATLQIDPRAYDPAHMGDGELSLVGAFLERGVVDFLGRDLGLACKDGSKRKFLAFKLRLLAAEWIYDVDDHGSPWSFSWACTLCDISADRLRTELQPLMVQLVTQYRAFSADLAIEIRRKQRAKGTPGQPLTPRQAAGLEKKRARDRKYYAALTPEEKEIRAAKKKAAKDRWVARRSKARAKAKIRREAKGRIDRACKR